jgi:hypothetical protein
MQSFQVDRLLFRAWLTDKTLPPHPSIPSPTRGEGRQEKYAGLKAPLPLWERGWGEGLLSFVSQPGARLLGVRLDINIEVEEMPRDWLDAQGYLRPEVDRKSTGGWVTVAIRNTKGMSTSLLVESLPAFRRPTAFGEIGKDPLCQIEDSKIGDDLEAVQDSATHVSIMPKVTMLLEKYETALASTQNDWKRVD